MFEPTSPLSPAGKRRRDAILADALRRSARRRQSRTLARSMGFLALCGLIARVALLRHGTSPAHPPLVAHTPRLPAPTVVAPPAINVTWIETDPTLLDRMRLAPAKPTWTMIDDDQLLRGLADAGKPASLAYVGGHVELLWRDPKDRD